jgi:hypothetical protein
LGYCAPYVGSRLPTFLDSISLTPLQGSSIPRTSLMFVPCVIGARGGAVVEALHYKPEGRGIDPDGIVGFFHWHNPSSRTMTLGSTQPLTEMSTSNNSWGKGGRCVGLTNLPASCADCLKIWEP